VRQRSDGSSERYALGSGVVSRPLESLIEGDSSRAGSENRQLLTNCLALPVLGSRWMRSTVVAITVV
jgi:hypothetical protein